MVHSLEKNFLCFCSAPADLKPSLKDAPGPHCQTSSYSVSPAQYICSKPGFLKQRCAMCPGHHWVEKCLWHSSSEGKIQTQLSRDYKPKEAPTASPWCTGVRYEEREQGEESTKPITFWLKAYNFLVKSAQSLLLYRMSWKGKIMWKNGQEFVTVIISKMYALVIKPTRIDLWSSWSS